jgi:iron complex outermembrane receptor protein
VQFVPPDFGLLLRHLDYICEENIEQSNEDHQDKFNSVHGYGYDTSLLNARWALTMWA